jgi:hypothetical protein
MGSSKRRIVGVVVVAFGGLVLQGCSSSGGQGTQLTQTVVAPSTSSPSTPLATSTAPSTKITEVSPSGDIPDNTQYVSNVFNNRASFVVPEGWSRQESGNSLTFTDKLNTVTLIMSAAPIPLTVQGVLASEFPTIQKTESKPSGAKAQSVKLKGDQAILLTYHRDSLPNDVTGKVAREAVERFTFVKGTARIDLILSCPISADNVDPWRIISNSFVWLK